METLTIYLRGTGVVLTGILFLLTAVLIAIYSILYRGKVYSLRERLPIPPNQTLSLALRFNVVFSWAIPTIVLIILISFYS